MERSTPRYWRKCKYILTIAKSAPRLWTPLETFWSWRRTSAFSNSPWATASACTRVWTQSFRQCRRPGLIPRVCSRWDLPGIQWPLESASECQSAVWRFARHATLPIQASFTILVLLDTRLLALFGNLRYPAAVHVCWWIAVTDPTIPPENQPCVIRLIFLCKGSSINIVHDQTAFTSDGITEGVRIPRRRWRWEWRQRGEVGDTPFGSSAEWALSVATWPPAGCVGAELVSEQRGLAMTLPEQIWSSESESSPNEFDRGMNQRRRWWGEN